MSRNLYKLIQDLEKRIEHQEVQIRLLQNNVSHLETLLRIKDKVPERPFYPLPETPWYEHHPNPVWMDSSDSITKSPKVTSEYKELGDDPFIKLMKETFDL